MKNPIKKIVSKVKKLPKVEKVIADHFPTAMHRVRKMRGLPVDGI